MKHLSGRAALVALLVVGSGLAPATAGTERAPGRRPGP
jgi:hypothetical protein